MSDLPDPTNITHDDCTKIIAAYQTGRLIDREDIDYEKAVGWCRIEMSPHNEPLIDVYWRTVERTVRGIVDAALEIKGDTT